MKRSKNNEAEYDIAIGQRIKTIRQKYGYSQQQIGKMIGVSFQQIQKYERAEDRISASRLISLSNALNIPATELLPDRSGKMNLASDAELSLLVTLSKRSISPALLNRALRGDEE